jgi:HlyD family secretion protein
LAYRHSGSALKQIRTLFSSGMAGGLTDAQLLERFTARRAETAGAVAAAEAAFAALVDRHGAMVWGVCRRITGDCHEAEDAFQATFLILARQAGSLWVDDSLGRWLRRIAHRVAVRARAEALRRRPPPALARSGTAFDPWHTAELEDLRAAVADEVGRLPQKYRAPVELCHLQGLKHDEAARLLGLPVGTVKSRLDRARRRLREMLTRRGLAPATAAAALSGEIRAAVPAALVRQTIQAAVHAARGGGELPASIVTLAGVATRAAIFGKLQVAAATFVLTLGGVVFAFRGTEARRGPSPASASEQPPTAGPPTRAPARGPEVASATSLPGGGTPSPSLAPSNDRRLAVNSTPLATSHQEAEGPEKDLGAAILKELRGNPKN